MVAMEVVYTASLPHGNSCRARVIVRRRDSGRDILFKVCADLGGGDRRPAFGLDFLDSLTVPIVVESRHGQCRGVGQGVGTLTR